MTTLVVCFPFRSSASTHQSFLLLTTSVTEIILTILVYFITDFTMTTNQLKFPDATITDYFDMYALTPLTINKTIFFNRMFTDAFGFLRWIIIWFNSVLFYPLRTQVVFIESWMRCFKCNIFGRTCTFDVHLFSPTTAISPSVGFIVFFSEFLKTFCCTHFL